MGTALLQSKAWDMLSSWVHIVSDYFPTELWTKNERLYVTPRSRGYRDITATFIRRLEIPSHMYVKHQCMQESECGSTVVIYIPTKKYKYMVITERYNITGILHHQKI